MVLVAVRNTLKKSSVSVAHVGQQMKRYSCPFLLRTEYLIESALCTWDKFYPAQVNAMLTRLEHVVSLPKVLVRVCLS